ncbi:DegT/DnrJ/EryC1/StrS family aminotransferase [bacterium]|nr:MAG: DegT/DnrJ/EryC1/StrS family aminotransferase [bacterium]
MVLPSDADASGRRFGDEELANLRAVLDSGTLNCTRGTFVTRLENDFAARYAGDGFFCTAVTSGTAAIHCAIAALDLEIGDEVVTTSVTDMGAITPILFQGAVPVFADIGAKTFNVSAQSIEAVLTSRTKAVVATHLFGVPCDIDAISDLCQKRGLYLIEDAAQAPYATFDGRRMGTFGDIGCFSLQQGKHFSCGEGGLTLTKNPDFARRMRLFHDKAWGYGDAKPDHYFAAPNYRMTELAGAVALAQLDRVEGVVRDRQNSANAFLDKIADFPGVYSQLVPEKATSVFWKVTLRIEPAEAGADVAQIGARLKEQYGIACAPRYVQKPAFECEVLRDKRTLGSSGWPIRDAVWPTRETLPGTYDALAHMLVLPWNENYTREHVDYISTSLRSTLDFFRS